MKKYIISDYNQYLKEHFNRDYISENKILEGVVWKPKGVDLSKTNTGGVMPPNMKKIVDSLRKELKDNGIKLGTITSGFRDAYNQGRIMYANWFSLSKNKIKSGEDTSALLKKRRKYLVKLYNDKKAQAVDDILASAYKESNDGKGGISPEQLKKALNNVEKYLKSNPISNHQGNRAIDVPPNSALKKFIKEGKSKFAEGCLDEGNHLHIKLRPYEGSSGSAASSTTKDATNKLTKKQIEEVQTFLKSKRYDLGTTGLNKDGVDGGFGTKTKAALKDWKSKNGMTNDSILNKEVYDSIKKGGITSTKTVAAKKAAAAATKSAAVEDLGTDLKNEKFPKDKIKEVQTFLKSKDYDLGRYGLNKDGVDGYYGTKTKAALKDWKSKNGMSDDSVLNKEVYDSIKKQG